jgi:hypothetical protein
MKIDLPNIYIHYLQTEQNCGGCNWGAGTFYIAAKDKADAEERMLEEGRCFQCLMEEAVNIPKENFITNVKDN